MPAITSGSPLYTAYDRQSRDSPGLRDKPVARADRETLRACMRKIVMFDQVGDEVVEAIMADMTVRRVRLGDVVEKQGDDGEGSFEMYVVKKGRFEIVVKSAGVAFKVGTRCSGDFFGETGLFYNASRAASAIATEAGEVWVLHRDVFKKHMQMSVERRVVRIEAFLCNVEALRHLTPGGLRDVAEAVEGEDRLRGDVIVREGDEGDKFYIIQDGEVAITKGLASDGRPLKVNHLFKTECFGETALISGAPRSATAIVESVDAKLLSLRRDVFIRVMGDGPRSQISDDIGAASKRRMALLHPFSETARSRPTSRITVVWACARPKVPPNVCTGHLDDVASIFAAARLEGADPSSCTLIADRVIGKGGFGYVYRVACLETGAVYALKRVAKSKVRGCYEHVKYEQFVTRNLTCAFCMRLHASFSDADNLYMLLDLMEGGDVLDKLLYHAHRVPCVEEEEVSAAKHRVMRNVFSCGADEPLQTTTRGMIESDARFYVACSIIALRHIHAEGYVFRDLKPENMFLDSKGWMRIGDFGFVKRLGLGQKTYTFCGTLGYLAPEVVRSVGYGTAVDWWSLGVTMYTLLTARNPFTDDQVAQMEVMWRITNQSFAIKFPAYVSPEARSLISALLDRNPQTRLGAGVDGAGDVMRHPWFGAVDWARMESRRTLPPALPPASHMSTRRMRLARVQRGLGAAEDRGNKNLGYGAQSAIQLTVDDVFVDF
jgi:cGMP-dependent protein kinase 2